MYYLIISFVIFWVYWLYTVKAVGIKSSISETVNHVNPWLFRLFIFGITTPMLFYASKVSVGIMISGSLIAWVGYACTIRGKATEIEYVNHVIGATGGIIAGYLTFGLEKLLYKGAVHGVEWALFYKDVYFWAIVAFLISAIIIMPIGKFKKGVKNHTTWIILTLIIVEWINFG
jgi:hypothetical protein